MSWLIPDITKPVKLKLTADDAKREAFGRTLSLTGAGVGILGGLIILSANPAVRAALKKGGPISLTLTAKQAQQDALGKSLALIGTVVGVGGSVMVMSTNPKMKPQFAKLYSSLPAALRENQRTFALAFMGALGLTAAYMIRAQNRAYTTA